MFDDCELILDLHCNHSTCVCKMREIFFLRKDVGFLKKSFILWVAGRQGRLGWLLANEKFPLQFCEIRCLSLVLSFSQTGMFVNRPDVKSWPPWGQWEFALTSVGMNSLIRRPQNPPAVCCNKTVWLNPIASLLLCWYFNSSLMNATVTLTV